MSPSAGWSPGWRITIIISTAPPTAPSGASVQTPSAKAKAATTSWLSSRYITMITSRPANAGQPICSPVGPM